MVLSEMKCSIAGSNENNICWRTWNTTLFMTEILKFGYTDIHGSRCTPLQHMCWEMIVSCIVLITYWSIYWPEQHNKHIKQNNDTT